MIFSFLTIFVNQQQQQLHIPKEVFLISNFVVLVSKRLIKMRLWKRATGDLKDRYRILVARLAPHGPCRNPNLESVIIKATSHDDHCMDYKNVQKVFRWLRTSPLYFKPILYNLSMRMEKTNSWVVALKGLMLTHGLFCFDLPAVHRMGRLPFDFSRFTDGHMSPEKGWGFNAFVRAYFAYLDHKSMFVFSKAKRLSKNGKEKETEEILMEELQNLEKLQGLIDMVLQVKPWHQNKKMVLILEAMDCIMDEVFELCDTFCAEIDRVYWTQYCTES
ncbi:putative ANTH domain-containing protein [Lupinus albus]|uniref:Putative ANTH domain-containing protein n=1 Tax=Lupinus albus TaxID=3870 RepID=A0A6A4NT37_LUPAL|nr:putative ANTH domain-containing protein [Lupinus albus]